MNGKKQPNNVAKPKLVYLPNLTPPHKTYC